MAIFLEHTGTRDLLPTLVNKLQHRGFAPLVLRGQAVKPEQREDWLKEHLATGHYDCLLCNPNLVKTGLDLLDFPTIVFFQCGYSVFTLRQACRRSWRIGQHLPVRVFYLAYAETMQDKALSLMAQKMETSLAVEGELSGQGLAALSESKNSMLYQLAKALTGQQPVVDVNTAWSRYRQQELAAVLDLDETGTIAKPWQAVHYGAFRNAITNRPYRGMNVLLLNLMALARGHVDPRWLTYRNAEQLGGHVRKGEKGAAIILWKFLPARDRDGDAAPDGLSDDEQEQKLIPFARSYTVFYVEQCEGLDLPPVVEEETPDMNQGNELAEKILALPNLKHGGKQACYLPGPDIILLPHRSSFEHDDFYFCTGYHETLHGQAIGIG